MKLISLILIFSFLASCNKKIETSAIRKDAVSITTSILKINIEDSYLQYYQTTNFNKKLNKFYAYNSVLHRIDYFQINEQSNSIGYVQLQKEGPNGIQPPNAIHITDNEDIFLIGYFSISEIDNHGNRIQENKINSTSDKDFYSKHFLFPSQDNGFEYNNEDNLFYISNTNMAYSKRTDPVLFFKTFSLVSQYNFDKDEILDLNIPLPKEFTKYNFEFNDLKFIHLTDNKIIYSFSPLPEIFEYNLATGKTTKFETPTKHLPYYRKNYKDFNAINNGFNLKSFLDNGNFGPIISTDNFIVRLYLSGTPDSKMNLNNNENHKESILQIFDRNYNFIKNEPIDEKLTFQGIFSKNDTLYFQLGALEEDEIRFLKVTLNHEDKFTK